MRRASIVVLGLVVAVCSLAKLARAAPSCSIELKNNGFSIMVGIADGVARSRNRGDRHDYTDLVASIREKFTKASEWLHSATRKRAYLSDVTVVVPDDWSYSSEIQCSRPCETFEKAKIRINVPRRDSRNRELHGAYVLAGQCGQEGHTMHLTASRIASPRHQGSPAEKMLVHELAHLRWGVGDEYYQSFYGYGADGKPSRCSVAVEPKINPRTGRYSFFTVGSATGSFMWQQFRRQIVDFCDDRGDTSYRHNRQAANSHNRRCNRDSVWTVLGRTRDFSGRNNPPRNIAKARLQPRFRFVRKCLGSCEVLAIDVSASMTGRMLQVQQAAAMVIDRAQSSAMLGIMPFAEAALPGVALATASPQRKVFLKQRIPKESDVRKKRTNIRAGIEEAMQRLTHNTACQQKKITIISDCGETAGAPVDQLLILRLKEEGIMLNSLTFDDNLPKCMLGDASRLSEGSSCNQNDPFGSDAAFDDCLAQQTPRNIPGAEQRIHFSMTTLAHSIKRCIDVCVDEEIGRDTRFTLNWNKLLNKSKAQKMWYLVAPSSHRLHYKGVNDYKLDTKLMMSSFHLPNAESGTWKVCLRNRHNSDVTFTLNVNTHARSVNVRPIEVEGYLGHRAIEAPQPQTLLVEVTKSMMPVIDANVTCTVTRPNSPPRTLVLYDNGMADDNVANDGVYTAMFSQYMGDGQYNVHCLARCWYDDNEDEFLTKFRKAPVLMDDAGIEGDQPEHGMGMNHTDSDDMVERMNFCCFTRHLSLGSFVVDGYTEHSMQVLDHDMVPPSAVWDLRVVSINNRSYPYRVHLRFTGTGDDMEVGDASFYDLRWSTVFTNMDDSRMFNESQIPEVVGHNPLMRPPQKTSPMEMVTIDVTVEICQPAMRESMVLFAMKALDEVGNVSPLSNVVRLDFRDDLYNTHCPEGSTAMHSCCMNMRPFDPLDVSWSNTPDAAQGNTKTTNGPVIFV